MGIKQAFSTVFSGGQGLASADPKRKIVHERPVIVFDGCVNDYRVLDADGVPREFPSFEEDQAQAEARVARQRANG